MIPESHPLNGHRRADSLQPTVLGSYFKVKHGFAFDGKFFANSGSHIVLTPGNFYEAGGFKAKAEEKWFKGAIPPAYVLQRGDLILAMTEQSEGLLGSAAVVPEDDLYLHNQRLGLVQVKPGAAIDKRYLYYLFNSADMRRQIQVTASGTKIRHTSPGRIEAVTAIIPSLPEQIRIGEILGSLDDKIELNRQMNQTLEELARATFRAWFIDFLPVKAKIAGATSFPGMDPATFAALPTEMVDTQHGEVPKGWRDGSLSGIADNARTQVRPSEILADTPYIGLEHMPRGSIALADWGIAGGVTSHKFSYKTGDTLFGKLLPYFHKVGVAPGEGVCSTDILVLRARSPHWRSVTALLASEPRVIERCSAASGGTKMPRTDWSTLGAEPLAVAPCEVGKAFEDVIGPMIDLIVSNISESRTLAATRDLLLPRLIGGKQ